MVIELYEQLLIRERKLVSQENALIARENNLVVAERAPGRARLGHGCLAGLSIQAARLYRQSLAFPRL
jgi:hypothetical protein